MASSGAAPPRVELGARSMIRPEMPREEAHSRPMFLSAFDIVFRWIHYFPIVFFYKLEGPKAFEEAVKTLKASLSKALLPFYPCAGQLFQQADGRLALDCNDTGVEFVEASIDLPFSSLEEDNFQYKKFFENFCTIVLKWTGPELPLLLIQVTKFPGGDGMALGISCCHVVADGSSLWSFLKS